LFIMLYFLFFLDILISWSHFL